MESSYHVILGCPFAKSVWFSSPLTIRSDAPQSHSVIDWFDWWFTFTSSLVDRDYLDSSVAFLCWEIWLARNNRLFNQGRDSPSAVSSRAISSLHEFLSIDPLDQLELHPSGVSASASSWSAPQSGCFKLNCDAAFCCSSSKSSIGMIIRDSTGAFVVSKSSPEHSDDIDLLEALAIKNGLLLALEFGVSRLEVESDSLVVITAILEGIVHTSCLSVLEDILLLADDFPFISFSHVSRSANAVADSLAKFALSHCTVVSFSCPQWLLPVFLADSPSNI